VLSGVDLQRSRHERKKPQSYGRGRRHPLGLRTLGRAPPALMLLQPHVLASGRRRLHAPPRAASKKDQRRRAAARMLREALPAD
jgi:hypothetical protein